MELKTIPFDGYEARSNHIMRTVTSFTSNGRLGVNMERALLGEADELDRKNELFFKKSGIKMRYRISVSSLIVAEDKSR